MTPDRDEILQAVSSAVLAVTRHLSVREVLQVIVRSAQRLLDARYAALGVPDDDGSFAEFVAEGLTDKQWDAIGPLPRQHGMLGAMLAEGVPARLPDLRADPRFEYWPKAHPVMKDFLGVPIRDADRVLGIIFLANKRTPGGFTQDDQELLTLFAAHAAIALTNARLYEQGRELALVEERNRMARELHDAVTQKLFALRLTAQAAATMLESAPDKAAAELERVQKLAGEALAELRAVIVELRPAELDRHGLTETLRKHVRMLDRLQPALISFDCDELPPLDTSIEVVVLRVAQEALHNALRHAHATQVWVRLSYSGGKLALAVTDNGRGFDEADSRGLGLASMRDRAESIGGALTVTSAPDEGTTVQVEVGI